MGGPAPWPSGLVRSFHCGQPGFRQFRSRVPTWHRSLGHVEAASHIPQLERPSTKIYNYLLGGFGEKKQKKKIHRFHSPEVRLLSICCRETLMQCTKNMYKDRSKWTNRERFPTQTIKKKTEEHVSLQDNTCHMKHTMNTSQSHLNSGTSD